MRCLWEGQNDAGSFTCIKLALKMLFVIHFFKLVLGFYRGEGVACDCRYRCSQTVNQRQKLLTVYSV